jgi:hypothetical protein
LLDSCHRPNHGRIKEHIQKLMRELVEACLEHQDKAIRLLKCKRLEMDEVWNFCYAMDKNLPDSMRGQPGVGSMWTWTALCAESKLIVSWRLGARDAANAWAFISDVSDRIMNRVQITTDGNRLYIEPIEQHMGGMVITQCWLSSSAKRRVPSGPTRPPSASARRKSKSTATQTWRSFRPAMRKGRT